jgi:hypothetical protein
MSKTNLYEPDYGLIGGGGPYKRMKSSNGKGESFTNNYIAE